MPSEKGLSNAKKSAQYSLLIDLERCCGCYACEVACKQENDIAAGVRWIRVVKKGPVRVGGKLSMSFVPIRCMHCGKPVCIDACPVGAITKRPDGIVLIDAELCNGCKQCIEVCPFGAPQFNPEKNVVEMCTLCVHRVDKGLLPNCVQHCPSRAMYFGDINEIIDLRREKPAAIVHRILTDTVAKDQL